MVLGIAGGKQVEHVSGGKKKHKLKRTKSVFVNKYLVKESKGKVAAAIRSYAFIEETYLALDR